MKKPQAILFDLDGTLLDTAPDLVYAINRLRHEHELPALALENIALLSAWGQEQ